MTKNTTICYCENYDEEEIEKVLTQELSKYTEIFHNINHDTKLLLKCDLHKNVNPCDALTTNPHIVAVLAKYFSGLGANCIIADFPELKNPNNIEKIYETTEMLSVSNQGNAELNTNQKIVLKDFDGLATKQLSLAQVIDEVDYIINIPKVHLDRDFGVRGCIDNLFGFIPSEMQEILKNKLFLPKDYYNYLLDIYSSIKNKILFNVADAIVISEIDNTPRIINGIVLGSDCLYTDEYIYKMLNLDPKDFSLFNEAKQRQLYFFDEPTMDNEQFSRYYKHNLTLPKANTQNNCSSIPLNKRKNLYNKYQERPIINITKCKGCKKCIETCPSCAIKTNYDMHNDVYAEININQCINCLRCVRVCPYQAISVKCPRKNRNLKEKMLKRQ